MECTGIRDEFDVFLAFCGVVVLVSNVSLSLGYAISSAVPSVQVALALGPMLLLPFLLFGGTVGPPTQPIQTLRTS